GGGDDCAVCGRVRRRVHPDLAWISPEGGSIAIDQVREVAETVTRMPFEASGQVVVIEHADTLSSDNAGAGNSLLKSLEEPAGRVVFVLLAERPARILPTIRSRVIQIDFPPVPDALLVAALRAHGIDEAAVATTMGMDLTGVARAARGDLVRAISLATGGIDAQRRADLLPVMQSVASGQVAPMELANVILARANTASEAATAEATAEFSIMAERMAPAEKRTFNAKSNTQGAESRTTRRARRARVLELQASLDDLASWWRDVLALAAGATEAVANRDRQAALTQIAAGPAGPRAVAALDAIDEAGARLRINNADEPVTIGALTAELAGLAQGRIRARRTLGAPARTPAGYDLALG
ncbi:MAG: polymerase delta prime subunit, partial [Thermoleophilia bacterium]|nr:polymerase delta prime subunit [Thermoleophilia bacterium]